MLFLAGLTIVLLAPAIANAECGQRPAGSRIVGGHTAKINSWPWQLSLRVHQSTHIRHICGASLINNMWAVTAAHCVDSSSNPNRYSLLAGAHHRTNQDRRGKVLKVSRVIKHEGFSMNHLRHDVAVLKLTSPVQLTDQVKTVCLPQHGSRVKTNAVCYITGWGRYNGASNALPTYLQESKVPIVGHSTCTRKNGNFVKEQSMVCVGGSGSSACNGDSGGPLVCLEVSRWVLRGAASWVTSKQCLTNRYSVYARISSYINWINSKIKGGDGGDGGGGGGGPCLDTKPARSCDYWKRLGYCKRQYVQYMKKYCKKSCGFC